jgi:hypothetical protein
MLAAGMVPGCLGDFQPHFMDQTLVMQVRPATQNVAYVLLLPLLVDEPRTTPASDASVAEISRSVRVQEGIGQLSIVNDSTYRWLLRLEATGPIDLGAAARFETPDLDHTEAYLDFVWSTGTGPDMTINVTIDYHAQSKLCGRTAHFVGNVDANATAQAQWATVPGSDQAVCT